MAQREAFAAPSAAARAEGYFFWSEGAKAALTDLADRLEDGSTPVFLEGVKGSGRASLLRHLADAWPGSARIVPLAAMSEEEPARAILAAFGHRPSGDAPAHLALLDFVEDETFARQPPLVVVPRTEGLTPTMREQLCALARSPSDGGAGLLLALPSMPRAETNAVGLAPLSEPETAIFALEILDRSEMTGSLDAETLKRLQEQSGGVIGEAARLLDEAVGSGKRRAAPSGESGTKAADLSSPSPLDIERAILALSVNEPGPSAAQSASKPPARLQTHSYPKIATGIPSLPESGPANDRSRPLDPAIAEGLEELANVLAGLQGRIEALRDQTQELPQRTAARRDLLVGNAHAFLAALEALDDDEGAS